MPEPVRVAVDTYVQAAQERDPVRRAALLEACFALDGRMVARGRDILGRAGVAQMFTNFYADPEVVGVRLLSAIDAQRTTFRIHSAVEKRDGTLLEVFDAGEIDAEGRISLILTFPGPLEPA